MIELAHQLRAVLYPFLAATSAVLALLFGALVVHRTIVGVVERRRRRLEAAYQPVVDRLLVPRPDPRAFDELRHAPPEHRPLIGRLLLAPLTVATGDVRAVIRDACMRLDLDCGWLGGLQSRRWWERAAAARALGAVQDLSAFEAILRLVNDDHEEVRAAAVESLGVLQDTRALPVLTSLLAEPSRHQRARVIEALRRFGDAAVPALLDRAAMAPQDRVGLAELLAHVRSARAVETLVSWMSAEATEVRAAAMHALGAVGLDDRTFYYAVRSLGDEAPAVRGEAAWALGRTRREDAAPYLDPLLDDEWAVAARAASALRHMGAPGTVALRRRSGDHSQAGDLARQMLWERKARVS
jgi:hypothetical protein